MAEKPFDEFDFETDFPDFEEGEEFAFDEEEGEQENTDFDFSEGEKHLVTEVEAEPAGMEETYQFESEIPEKEPEQPGAEIEKKEFPQETGLLKNLDAKKKIIYALGALGILVFIVFMFLQRPSAVKVPSPATKTASEVATHHMTNAVSPPVNMPPPLSTTSASQEAPVINNVSPPTVPTSTISQAPQTMTAPIATTNNMLTEQNDQTQKTISALIQQNQQLAEEVQTLQNTIVELNSKFNTLQQQVQANDTSVVNLQHVFASNQSQMSKINTALKTIVSAMTASAAPRPSMVRGNTGFSMSKPRPIPRQAKSFFVQAIIPGRAWLEDGEGQTITVTYGDEVPGFGQVTEIDPQNGFVATSSGIKILYGISQT